MHTGMFATLNQQELYEFLIEAKNEWNKRFDDQPKQNLLGFPIIDPMKKAYLHFEVK